MNMHSTFVADAPHVSIVVPVHNGARWLGETLESLYAQSLKNFEVILVDDASTDEIGEVLNRHPDARLRVIHLNENIGVSGARNHGIGLASGQCIAFCDADDLCHPLRLEKQWTFLEEHEEIGLCGSAFTCFDTQDRDTVTPPETSVQIRKAMMRGNCFGLSTVMAKTPLLKAHRFDTSIGVAEDYELWSRLVAAGVQAANLSTSLVRYRLHPQQASKHKGSQLDQISRRVRALYCARLLGDQSFVERLLTASVEQADLVRAAQKVADHVAQNAGFSTRDFRFLLAWLYQQQPRHNILAWWGWTRIQARLDLNLDRNYRINTALLALIPMSSSGQHFDTLIKLKR